MGALAYGQKYAFADEEKENSETNVEENVEKKVEESTDIT